MDSTMRAARYDRYGPPEVLTIRKVPVPKPGRGEVLVRVCATSVNPIEAAARGGVGSSVPQLARAKGAVVSAVASGRNREFDAVIDLHGTSLDDYRRHLATGGRMVSLSPRALRPALISTVAFGPRIRLARAKATVAGLDTLARHIADGDLRPVVDQTYPLSRIADAHRDAETGHGRGKRVIDVTEGES